MSFRGWLTVWVMAIMTIAMSVTALAATPDQDGDGDVDLSDFSQLQVCFLSEDPVCSGFDSDQDSDVDLPDAAAFVACLFGPDASGVNRVVVSPASLLLTEAGQTHQLTAQAFDSDDNPVAGSIRWSTSDSAVVTIDQDGMVTAITSVGSAQLVAEVCGVSSPPVLTIVAVPAAGAMLVTDAQVIGDPTPVDPDAPYESEYLYRVTLSGIDLPQVGQILMGTGEKPVGGRVVEVVQNGETTTVTLELVGLDEFFETLKINETVSFSNPELASSFFGSVRCLLA